MGLYPEVWIQDETGTRYSLEDLTYRTGKFLLVRSEPGVTSRKEFEIEEADIERTDCYCCSCSETEFGGLIGDAACRNHGFAGRRPCDIHNLPGSEWDPEMVPGGGLPDPVSIHRESERPFEWSTSSNPEVVKIERGRMVVVSTGRATVTGHEPSSNIEHVVLVTTA